MRGLAFFSKCAEVGLQGTFFLDDAVSIRAGQGGKRLPVLGFVGSARNQTWDGPHYECVSCAFCKCMSIIGGVIEGCMCGCVHAQRRSAYFASCMAWVRTRSTGRRRPREKGMRSHDANAVNPDYSAAAVHARERSGRRDE